MSQAKVPYAAYPKYGPDVLGRAEYDRQMERWTAYQAYLRNKAPEGDNEYGGAERDDSEGRAEGHYDYPETGGQGQDPKDAEGGSDDVDTFTYVRKYTLPGQSRQRVFRRQGIEAGSKGQARHKGRQAMTEALGAEGVDWQPVGGTERVAKPRGKPFEPGEDPRRNEDGTNGTNGAEGQGEDGEDGAEGQGGQGEGQDDTPKMPTCPECGAPKGTTEGCCKQEDPGEMPKPEASEPPAFDLQILRTGSAPHMGEEAETRLRQAAHPEVVEVLTKSLADVDAWTRALVKHDVGAATTEVYASLERSYKALSARIGRNGHGGKAPLTKGQVRAIVADAMKGVDVDLDTIAAKVAEKIGAPQRIVVESGGETREITGTPHKAFEPALKAVKRGLNVFLVGPAGSGKGFLAKHLAEALGRRFGFVSCSEGMSEGMLLGRGVPLADRFLYLQSSFVDFYENGGVFLLDEVDAANPNVLLIINECLSSPHLSIPNRTEKPYAERHPDFVALVAANTWGTGPNMEYVGRNRLDAAFLNRFVGSQFEIGYDARVEGEIAKAYLGATEAEPVLRRFWGVRKKLEELSIRRIWSTRGLEKMCIALADGDTLAEVLDSHTRGWTHDERSKAGVA